MTGRRYPRGIRDRQDTVAHAGGGITLAGVGKRIGILIVAYNAASTLPQLLDRIPSDFRSRIFRVLVSDDHSSDATYLVGVGYKQLTGDLPMEVIRHPRNLGYGGNQKVGYHWAIDEGLDIVVLLHGDGQYAPELLPEIVAPLERGEADAVLGSRMLDAGAARKGGMPLYKWVGNRILTRVQNATVGTALSEWHSGYRAYSVAALRDIPFDRNSDGFNFDTQVAIQLIEAGKRITEVPIPTYYGDEICYVNGLRYARDIVGDVVRYRAHKMGFGSGELAFASSGYELKHGADTSHQKLLDWLSLQRPQRILDLGCADGSFGARLRDLGHHVTGVDLVAQDRVQDRVDQFVGGDLNVGLPEEIKGPFDVVIAADVLEHVRWPGRILDQIRPVLSEHGRLVVSVPNFGHWYPRTRVALGKFDYDRRGILDRDHVRFFTRSSFERLATDHGFRIQRRDAIGLPIEVIDRGNAASDQEGVSRRSAKALERLGVWLRPTLFAYQFVYELVPAGPSAPDPDPALGDLS